MKHRRAMIGVITGASLLGTAGVAHATHQDPGYSPCRSTEDDLRLGYSDEGDQSDPRHELPTVYANGGPDDGTNGNIGVCGGGSRGQEIQYVEVGNGAEGPYVDNSDPEAPVSATAAGIPVDGLGAVNVGEDYVEVDGEKDNPATTLDERLDGYASAGLTEADDGPGVCMSGENNHAYYEAQPQAKDCNEALVEAAVSELTG